MKGLSLILLLVFLSACGSHKQNIVTVSPKEELKQGGENDPVRKLFNAINSSDTAEIERLVKSGLDVNLRNNEGLTTLMVAVKAEQFASLEKLIELSADPTMRTENSDYDPALDCFEYMTTLEQMDEKTKGVMTAILKKEDFNVESLSLEIYQAIDFYSVNLFKWLLDKGVDPNYIRKTETGREKDTPLIYLFTLRGVKKDQFIKLKQLFEILAAKKSLDVNLKIGRYSPLQRAQRQVQGNPDYQYFVDRLVELGAK